ncbi:MAG: O-antigen ligase family protein [Clostridia bacterium]|nr:O-antigen ligase family protein [Clostridia bacterium]
MSLLWHFYGAAARALSLLGLFPLACMLFGALLYQKRSLSLPAVRVALAAGCWLICVYLLNANRVASISAAPYLTRVLTVLLLCLPLGALFDAGCRMKVLRFLCWIWLVPVACSAVLAVALALSGGSVILPNGLRAGVFTGYFEFFGNPNMYAMHCCLAFCLCLYLLFEQRRPALLALLAVAALALYAALVVTNCRSAILSVFPVVFLYGAAAVSTRLPGKRLVIRLLLGALAGAALCLLLLLALRGMLFLLEHVRSGSGAAVPAASSFVDLQSMGLRVTIYRYALSRFGEAWDLILRGATPVPAYDMFLDPAMPYSNLHSAYLAILLYYGLPGLLLFLAFILYLAVCSCRLLFSRQPATPLSERCLPVLLLPILAINAVEEMLFARNFMSSAGVLLAIIGGYVVVLAREQAARRAAPEAAASGGPRP